ncbi:MAG: hypothetical protein GQE15_05020 [Archangiaceae bacterium]|nr:hypothetical protein [Archangiaceae bacterium]
MTFYYQNLRGSLEPFGELSIQNITGQRGLGHHRLLFNFYVAANPRPPELQSVRLTDLKCEVSVTRPGATPLPLGFLTSGGQPISGELYDGTRGNGFTVMMYLEADAHRLKALDDLRAGEGVTLSLRIHPECMCDGRRGGQSFELSYALNQSSCIELLRNAGYADRQLIEVPSPESIEDEQLRKAVEDLGTATDHLRVGHWRPAVASCRDSIEAVTTALGDVEFVNRANLPGEDLFVNLRTMSKDDRLRLLRRVLMALTAPAHHRDEHVQHIEWEPEDARAIVAISSAVVSLFADRN